jgi:phenylalanyl-tRNA synthetase beta chain
VLALLASLAIPSGGLQVVAGGPDFLHPGRSARLQMGPRNPVGLFGELHPRTLDAMGASGPFAVFEIILDVLPAPKAKPTKARGPLDLPALMPLDRDFAFVVEEGVSAADILRAVQAADRTLITGAEVFDVYRGLGVPEGRKSVAVTVRLQPRIKTMTDAELEALSGRIEAEVAKKTGAVLRR